MSLMSLFFEAILFSSCVTNKTSTFRLASFSRFSFVEQRWVFFKEFEVRRSISSRFLHARFVSVLGQVTLSRAFSIVFFSLALFSWHFSLRSASPYLFWAVHFPNSTFSVKHISDWNERSTEERTPSDRIAAETRST